MAPVAILADLALRYPDGCRFFTGSAKRVPEPSIVRTIGGFWSVNVNGYSHLYDDAGVFLSSDANRNRGLSNRT